MEAQKQEITIKLSLDATEALETLAKVKAELEQVITLQERVKETDLEAQAKGPEPMVLTLKMDGQEFAKYVIKAVTDYQRQTKVSINV